MANLFRGNRLRVLGVVVVLVVLAVGLQQYVAWTRPPIDWNSSKMGEIEADWNALSKRYEPIGKTSYVHRAEARDDLLAKYLSRRDMRHLAQTCDALPVAGRSEFIDSVLAFLVYTFTTSGDRDSLVELLSRQCPSHIFFYSNIEFCLPFYGKTLKDPILILGEAYSRCKNPTVRHDLAAAVRRGFVDVGIHGKNDAEFVKNAMEWYEKEKHHLTVNPDFVQNEFHCNLEIYESHPEYYENPPRSVGAVRKRLFLMKPSK